MIASFHFADNCIRTFMNQCATIQRNTAVMADAAIRVEEIHNEVIILSIFAYQISEHQSPHLICEIFILTKRTCSRLVHHTGDRRIPS